MRSAREDEPTVATRWWVDMDETRARGATPPTTEAAPPVGGRFFDVGYGFDRDEAPRRLTDLDVKLLAEARPPEHESQTIRPVQHESVPQHEIEGITRRLPLPPGAWGVIVDSGRSARFVLTGDPVGERVLDSRLARLHRSTVGSGEIGYAKRSLATSTRRSAA